MNILNEILPTQIWIRTVLKPTRALSLDGFTMIPTLRISGSEPTYTPIGPFGFGYAMEIRITTCADLRYIAERRSLVQFISLTSGGQYIQIGSDEGFLLTDIVPQPSPGQPLSVFVFTTDKPNKQPFKIIEL